MAVSASKTWVAGEILTASDLNSEFTNIYSNGQTVGFPRTSEADFDGQELWLDSDKDSSITADTDDRIDVKMQGKDLYRFDGTVSSAVDGLDFIAAATANPSAPSLTAFGESTNISINLVPKGSGVVSIAGSTVFLNESDQHLLANQVFG